LESNVDTKTVVGILEEIAVLLELKGENPFKSRTYTNVARNLEQHVEDVQTLVAENRLREVKGVGDALEQKIEELVTTGELIYHQKLRAEFPDTLFDLFGIPGLGGKRIKTLYRDVGITSLDELEKACNEDRIAALKGFGAKSQNKILEGVAFARLHEGQHLVHKARAEADRLLAHLKKSESVIRIEVAGSLRRCKEVVKDVDIIASAKDPQALMKRFVEFEDVTNITGHGDTKSSIVLESGIAADLRVVTDEQFPYALHHFTGSKEHNVAMRQRAKERGLKMNEYGLFDENDDNISCKNEAAIFKKLELPFIPPELREDNGELALKKIPPLIEQEDLIGVVHCHSTYSDGRASIEEMATAAKALGFKYFGLADHSQSAAYAGGLREAAIVKQHQEIDALNAKLKGIRILKGIESDIRADGTLDYPEKILKQFDFIVASVHSNQNMNEAEATKRVLRAIEDPHTTILGHPTGRLLLQREGYPLKWDAIFEACAKHRVAIEINANPRRLDIDWRLIKRAKEHGIMFSIGPDAHSIQGLEDVQYGVGIARKGCLTPDDILNCLDAEAFVAWKDGDK
jgi:DNA polymerase (family 10)